MGASSTAARTQGNGGRPGIRGDQAIQVRLSGRKVPESQLHRELQPRAEEVNRATAIDRGGPLILRRVDQCAIDVTHAGTVPWEAAFHALGRLPFAGPPPLREEAASRPRG